jgi:hypothetical protein
VRRKIQELQPNPVLRVIDRWRPDSEIRSWADGLAGERLTARRLGRLRGHGWFLLHAIQWASGADVDHLAIGPGGVFSINSKRHRGKSVWYGDAAITVNAPRPATSQPARPKHAACPVSCLGTVESAFPFAP